MAAMDRHNATVQFPTKDDYLKLKALSILMDETIGVTLQRMTDKEADRVGLKVLAWDRQKQLAKARA